MKLCAAKLGILPYLRGALTSKTSTEGALIVIGLDLMITGKAPFDTKLVKFAGMFYKQQLSTTRMLYICLHGRACDKVCGMGKLSSIAK